jgi:putative ABC transport system ATP-binding protein
VESGQVVRKSPLSGEGAAGEGRAHRTGEAVVEALDVQKTYVLGRVRVAALRGVSLRIERGEIVAIVGPSGCGKTTLLHCLSGLEDFDAGEVVLEGLSLARLSDGQKADHRARRVGFVFQSYNLLPVLNALENVELPLLLAGRAAGEARRRAMRALEVVGLENRLRHRPSELSGGQQQRVAVARALATEPAVIFADEPTGNLDSDSAEEVMQLIDRLNRENAQTFVLVTHAREVAAHAGRVIRMRDGEIVADGLAREEGSRGG